MAVGGVLWLLYLGGQLWGFANIKLRTEQVEEDTLYDFCAYRGTGVPQRGGHLKGNQRRDGL